MTPMLHRRHTLFSLLSTLALLATITPAAADPIPITVTGGFIEFEGVFAGPQNQGRFVLTGTDGFMMTASGNSNGPLCQPCPPGDTVGLSAFFDADFGSITYQGVTREFEAGGLTPGGGELFVQAASVVLPPVGTADVLRVATSFSLDPSKSIVGVPVVPDPEGPPPPPEQIFQLSGGGRGEATFRVFGREREGSWVIETMRFDFEDQAAIPEPSSVLLVGSVMTGAWLRRRFRGAHH